MITEKIILQACKQFSNLQNIKNNWVKVKTNIFVNRLDKTNTGFLNLITRYPKFECKATEEGTNIFFEFFLLWKFKGIKELQSQLLGKIVYNGKSFSKLQKI